MNAGKLRHRIEIWGKSKGQNELKETVYNDAKLYTVWAEIVPQTGRSAQQTETILTNVTHKIIIRYNKQIEAAYQDEQTKNDLHIRFKGHRFNIAYILNPYFRNEKLEIFAEEVIG